VQAEGSDISLREDLSAVLLGKVPGDLFSMTVLRGEELFDITVELIGRMDNPDAGAIGITTTTFRYSLEMPFDIKVMSEDIGGSSAGLMMTLEIMNQLSEDDLTGGHRIAGTGTVDLSGRVGSIGGVRQKVMGAIDNNAEYFLSPRENYSEARGAANNRITVIEISYLEDALEFLRGLG
jgi:PDZ domain-containing protein